MGRQINRIFRVFGVQINRIFRVFGVSIGAYLHLQDQVSLGSARTPNLHACVSTRNVSKKHLFQDKVIQPPNWPDSEKR